MHLIMSEHGDLSTFNVCELSKSSNGVIVGMTMYMYAYMHIILHSLDSSI